MRYYKVYYTQKGSRGFTHNKWLGVVAQNLLTAVLIVLQTEPDANIINVVHGGIVHVTEKRKLKPGGGHDGKS